MNNSLGIGAHLLKIIFDAPDLPVVIIDLLASFEHPLSLLRLGLEDVAIRDVAQG